MEHTEVVQKYKFLWLWQIHHISVAHLILTTNTGVT